MPRLLSLFRSKKLWALCAALALIRCVIGGEQRSQGGSSDTETLTGLVKSNTGEPVAGAVVKLLPSAYDPAHPDTTLRVTTSDARGQFAFKGVAKGRYFNVIAGLRSVRCWAMAESLRVGTVPLEDAPTVNLTLDLERARLYKIAFFTAPGAPSPDSGVAYFPGTDILARCNGTDTTEVDSVPRLVDYIVLKSPRGWSYDTLMTLTRDTVEVQADSDGIICAR